jgi:conjugative relaxase-like TrwC/TraI family protein
MGPSRNGGSQSVWAAISAALLAQVVVSMMTVHKLSAGDGYTYLTRQVASADERRAGQSLADYYVARGNPAGVWLGSGAAALGVASTEVTETQMRALFGSGCHPDREAMMAAGVPEPQTRLGAAYPNYAPLAPYEERVAKAVAEFAASHDRHPSASERNRIAAREARRGRRAVAGFDLVFTPVKSASVLWGLGGPEIRGIVEYAHHEAVASALTWIEKHAAFTRTGHAGTAQVDTTGLVAAAFDHRESRSGDPDLHTHVAVANKVCGLDGKWRSLDARGLHAIGVAASERYNTRFEDALARRLGVVFVERPGRSLGKQPVREISGIPLELLQHFSKRRAAIETRYAELRHDYRAEHGRDPNRSTQLQLAQQATLETREGKPAGRTLAEQVSDWTDQATGVVGSQDIARMLSAATHRTMTMSSLTDDDVADYARRVVHNVAEQRSTWTRWNIYAETERVLRPLRFASASERESATDSVVTQATSPSVSIRIAEPALVVEPSQLTRGDGQSVFVPHGSERYTTSEVLTAEDTLIEAGSPGSAGTTQHPIDLLIVEAAVAALEAETGVVLDHGQRSLVHSFTRSTARLAVGIGPAGAGKTTAMRAFTSAWEAGGGRVVLLATSSKAAQVLGSELGARAENLHKFLHENRPQNWPENHGHPGLYDAWFQLHPGDVVVVDEAGMAGTLHLTELVRLATDAGASVRLLGDPAQLAAVDAGGALRLLEREVGAAYLTDLHRFSNPDEAMATLGLRAGDTSALDFYENYNRIRSGSRDGMLEDAYAGWARDLLAGSTSVLIAATSADVIALNTRARLERVLAGQVESDGITLHDGNQAGVGDWVITRTNARVLTYRRGQDWVRNGDTWIVQSRHEDGSLTLQNRSHPDAHAARIRLPASYVADSVELGYAVTAHRVQGATTDTAHALVTPEMTREALYVASTRGREATTWYAATDPTLDIDGHTEPHPAATVHELLTKILARSGSEDSAHDTLRKTDTEARSLRVLVARYQHARALAARDSLGHHIASATGIPARERQRLLHDSGAGHLAEVLADAASRGGNPARVLQAAYDLGSSDAAEPGGLQGAHSPALVLATRIQDYATTLGLPARTPNGDEARATGRPLPWLHSPEVGHDGWRPYLASRAQLIAEH